MHNPLTLKKHMGISAKKHLLPIRHLIIITAAAAILTACGGDIKLSSIDKSYSTDTISVNAKIPQISGLGSKNLQASINEEYLSTVSDLLNNFSKTAKSTSEQSTFDIKTTQHYNKNGFYSSVVQIDYCSKHAQQNSFRITKNIDTKRCVELTLSDLFSDDSYIDMLNERINAEVEQDPDKYSDLWEKPRLVHNQQFYINEKNLIVFYPPYELSYYERGFVEIPLKLEDMSGYLKPEYRQLAAR